MRKKYRHLRIAITLSTATFWFVGCHVSAPIHVWVPPKLQSAVGHKVAIAPIVGEPKIAGPLLSQMLTQSPRDAGRMLECTDLRMPSDNQTIRLVSAVEGETSDIASLAVAKRQGADYLLTGEILRRPGDVRAENHRVSQGRSTPDSNEDKAQSGSEEITVSWKLTDLRGSTGASGFPIVTRHEGTLDSQGIAQAAAKDAWNLITPHVIQNSAKLASPRLSIASGTIRRGNNAAQAGDWATAEHEWNRVATNQPRNHAALHNLAIAAVSRQDYDNATRLIGTALNLSNKPLYRETAVWIEAKQRDYYEAFGLPDPPQGWSAIRR